MYPILDQSNAENFSDFISFWASLYNYSPKKPVDNRYYYDNIHRTKYDYKDIEALFTWKNGMTLSEKKSETVNTICKELHLINEMKYNNVPIIDSLHKIRLREGVWKIFLLHITKPDYYPIFDQHTYRAYHYLKYDTIEEITKVEKTILEFYLNEYIPFIHEKLYIIRTNEERFQMLRKIDKALFTFGKFLKSDYTKLISPTLDIPFFRHLFASVYAMEVNNKYDYQPDLKYYLKDFPEKESVVQNLFRLRDFYMQNNNYEKRWELGYYVMDNSDIQFEQSEGSELIFSLCCAIKDEFSFSNTKIICILNQVQALQTI
jgi:hypothetical protein